MWSQWDNNVLGSERERQGINIRERGEKVEQKWKQCVYSVSWEDAQPAGV
jgi:hypothetical protein